MKGCLDLSLRAVWTHDNVLHAIQLTVRDKISYSPSVGRGRDSLKGKRGCWLLKLQEQGFVRVGLQLQLVCCTWVSSLGVPNLHGRSEPIRGKRRTDAPMRQHWVTLRELRGFGDDREGQYSAHSGTSQVDSEVLLSSGLWPEDNSEYSSIQSSNSKVGLGRMDKKVKWGSWEDKGNLEGMGIKTVMWWWRDEITQRDIQTEVLVL